MQTVLILPARGGWVLRSTYFQNEQFFRSQGSAESAAIRLAHAFADAGEDVEIRVELKDGGLAKHLAVPALQSPFDHYRTAS